MTLDYSGGGVAFCGRDAAPVSCRLAAMTFIAWLVILVSCAELGSNSAGASSGAGSGAVRTFDTIQHRRDSVDYWDGEP